MKVRWKGERGRRRREPTDLSINLLINLLTFVAVGLVTYYVLSLNQSLILHVLVKGFVQAPLLRFAYFSAVRIVCACPELQLLVSCMLLPSFSSS